MHSTPDLCDDNADLVRVVTGLHWRSYGGREQFGGPIATDTKPVLACSIPPEGFKGHGLKFGF